MSDPPRSEVEHHALALADPAKGRPPSPFDALDGTKIVATAEKLSRRIHDRFPTSSLASLGDHLFVLAKDAETTADWIGKPNVALRCVTGLFAALIVFAVVVSVATLPFGANLKLVELVAVVEAAINDLVLIGAAVFFLVTLETRLKRKRALESLHRLRSLAHIIDMHQLTKTPDRLEASYRRASTSPKPELDRFELERYFDYCSEMLSITGKIAAVYIQHFDDGVALQAVTEIEELTTGLARKIYQKRTVRD